jgi:hypothetical protein
VAGSVRFSIASAYRTGSSPQCHCPWRTPRRVRAHRPDGGMMIGMVSRRLRR